MSENFFKIVKRVVIAVLCLLILWLLRSNKELESSYESYKKDGTYIQTYQDKTIRQLKKENKELYDSIKNKKNVTQAISIDYKYEYAGETIYVDSKTPIKPDSVYTFEKSSDSVSYVAKVKSGNKPEWLKVDISLNDKLILVNREKNGKNELTINADNGTIESATVFTPIDKKDNFINRFSIGLQAGAGYGIFTKTPDIYVGIGVSFRLNKLK